MSASGGILSFRIQNKDLESPACKAPAGGNEVRHIEGIGCFDVSDCTEYNHPVKEFRITCLTQLLQRIIGQSLRFSFPHDFQKLMIKFRIDLADSRGTGKMGQPPRCKDRHPLSASACNFPDQLPNLIATSRCWNGIDPSIHVNW